MSFSISCALGELVSLTSLNFQIIALNPQMRSFLDSNSQLREMMQNPEVLRQLTSPDTMQVHIKVFQLLSLLTPSPPPTCMHNDAFPSIPTFTFSYVHVETLIYNSGMQLSILKFLLVVY